MKGGPVYGGMRIADRVPVVSWILASVLAWLPAFPPSVEARAWQSTDGAVVERRVEELLARMTLDEKVGQLNLAPNNPSFDMREVTEGHVGGVLAFTGPRSIAQVQAAARSSRLGIPLLVGLDVLRGLRTMFPLGLAEAASFDPTLARLSSEVAAREAVALGFNWTFAPMADLARDPRWGRMIEGFGEDPLLGRLFTRARVEGFRAGGLATTLKHFAGYGAAQGGRDYDAAEISNRDLFDNYLPPFRAGIEAGAESVMSAFHTLNGVPATANPALLTTILRERWRFDGFVVSDWDAVSQLMDHGAAAGPAEAAVNALTAGVDMDMSALLYRKHLGAAVRDGHLSEAAVTEAARRVLRAKIRMGLFERPSLSAANDAVPPPTAETRAAARRIAQDTIVLLRNTGVLPLGAGLTEPPSRRIAVIGGMAQSPKALIGPHGALVDEEDGLSVLDAMRRRAERAGASVAFSAGCAAECADEGGFGAAIETARNADAIVAVLGEPEGMTGEGGSRAYLTLPYRQAELLRRLVETGKPVVLVLIASRPIELGPVVDRLAGLLMGWFPGTEGGNALADILFGDVAPSGKLPISWPRTVGQVPVNYDRLPTGRTPDAENRYTLRYVDEELTPLFPFGFGLTYTDFKISDPEVVTPRLPRDGSLELRVRLTNTGSRPGREIVQLYVRQLVSSVSRPLRRLKAFEKVALGPGESRVITLRVPAHDLGFHREDGSYTVEPGRFVASVGASSLASLNTSFEVVE